MHSPPVQPISSSTSGTGSVITMWLEVDGQATAKRPVAGERRARRRARRRGRARARRSVSPRRPGPSPAGAGPASARTRSPRARRARAEARAPGVRAGRWRPRGRRPRRGRSASRSGLAHLGLGRAAAGARLAKLGARVAYRAPRAVMGRSGRDLQVSPARYQASTPCSAHQARSPRPRPRCACELAAPRPRRSAPKRGRLDHIALTKPPLRPLGPAPHRSASSRPPAPRARARRRTRRPTSRCTRRRPRRRRHRRPRASGAPRLGHPASSMPPAYGVCFSAIGCSGAAPRRRYRDVEPGAITAKEPALRLGSRHAPSTRAGRCAARRRVGGGVQTPSAPRTQALVLSARQRSSASSICARIRASSIGVTSSTRL